MIPEILQTKFYINKIKIRNFLYVINKVRKLLATTVINTKREKIVNNKIINAIESEKLKY